jgi:hypothetical protein
LNNYANFCKRAVWSGGNGAISTGEGKFRMVNRVSFDVDFRGFSFNRLWKESHK